MRVGLVALVAGLLLSVQVETTPQAISTERQLRDRYCATCHNDRLKTGGLSLEGIDVATPNAHPEIWEKVVRKLRTGVMPPPNMLQPPRADRVAMATRLETSLDMASVAK